VPGGIVATAPLGEPGTTTVCVSTVVEVPGAESVGAVLLVDVDVVVCATE
jgi:hypothetical protein